MVEDSAQTESTTGSKASKAVERKWARTAYEYAKTILLTMLVALFLKTFVVEAFRIPSASMENTLMVGDFLLVNKFAYGIRTPRHLPLTTSAIPSLTVPLLTRVHRGDVVVFEFPGNPNELQALEPVNFIKRCIGLPGDTVEIRNGRVTVNGVLTAIPTHGVRPGNPESRFWHRSTNIFPNGAGFTDVNYGPLIVPKRGARIPLAPENVERWETFIARERHSLNVAQDGTVLVDGKPTHEYTVVRDYYFVMGDNRDNSLDSRYWGFVPEENLVGEALFVYWSWHPKAPVPDFLETGKSVRWDRIGTIIR